jgi:hypothetical protein
LTPPPSLLFVQHDPEKWYPVFRDERIRSSQIMLKQKDGIMMRRYRIMICQGSREKTP